MRLVVAGALIAHGVTALALVDGPPIGDALKTALAIGLAVLLVIGLWTPIAGVLVALGGLWSAALQPTDRWYSLMVGILGLAIGLLGPGAWSVDARLFGWRRVQLENDERRDPPL